MIGMSRPITDLKVGDRFFVGHRRYVLGARYPAPVYEAMEVREIAGQSLKASNEAGELVEIYTTSYSGHFADDIGGQQVLWLDPLPNGTLDQQKGYALFADTADHSGALLWVTSIAGGRAVARLVEPAFVRELSPSAYDEGFEWTGYAVGNAAFWSQAITVAIPDGASWKAGDLIAATSYRIDKDGDTFVMAVKNPVQLIHCESEDAVGAFMPASPGEASNPNILRSSGRFPAPSNHVMVLIEQERAIAATEPDEALVLWYRPPGATDTSCHVLSGRGLAFYDVDSVNDYLEGDAVEPGLWVFENASWWSTEFQGEHDAGIEGSWRPANLADLVRFGFDGPTLDREIAEVSDMEFVVGLANSHVEMAQAAPGVDGPAPEPSR